MTPSPDLPIHRIDLSQAKLEDARRFPGCVLILGCEICGWVKGYDVAKIISRLYELRDGGFQTPVADVARSVKHLCPKCRGKHWSTHLAYPAHVTERESKRLANQYRN
ncbi:hypothetical protein [Phenylobacterium sp.]|uniref:hypothetical protein n=1 Tax=Phenylobacterium sp. TaxID=1871053 RepID=UPI0010DB2813|nr:hypothetical protein [Phenylobacterium sp.]MDP3592583.1 hypothetical protein [Phenylobacterium sp.]RYG16981.1 MAG: hypothetical protein EON96_07685 [Caulobacteraceae bacterium]